MIDAKIDSGDSLAARLSAKAKSLTVAAAENRIRARRNDAWRWRTSTLLWPLFGKER